MVASFLLGLIFYTYLFKYIYLLIRGFLRWLLGFVHEWRQKPQVLHHQHLWINRSQNSWHSLPFANSIFTPNKINVFFLVILASNSQSLRAGGLIVLLLFFLAFNFLKETTTLSTITSDLQHFDTSPNWHGRDWCQGRRVERNKFRRKQRMVNGEGAGNNLEVFSDRKVVQEYA